jgi:hypothetical protein
MSSWKNWRNATTGKTTDIAIVKSALTVIKACLDNARASSTTDLYLKDSTSISNRQKFNQGVVRLKKHVVEYQNTGTTGTRLFVAYQDVPGALASSPPTSKTTLELGSDLKGVNTLIIHASFTGSFVVSGVSKSMTDWGRYATVLHELTHSLLLTKDVWIRGTVYGIDPPDPGNAVTTDTQCKALANAANVNMFMPLSWFNAENWTRAIASCHPTLSGSDMYVLGSS